MNRNGRKYYEPICLGFENKMGYWILGYKCPKCQSFLDTGQSKCKCGCNIQWTK